MKVYNLVISCPRCTVPNEEALIDFLEEKLHVEASIDYFGQESDNQNLYGGGNQQILDQNNYITIQFEHEDDLDPHDAIKILKESVREKLVKVTVDENGKDLYALFVM